MHLLRQMANRLLTSKQFRRPLVRPLSTRTHTTTAACAGHSSLDAQPHSLAASKGLASPSRTAAITAFQTLLLLLLLVLCLPFRFAGLLQGLAPVAWGHTTWQGHHTNRLQSLWQQQPWQQQPVQQQSVDHSEGPSPAAHRPIPASFHTLFCHLMSQLLQQRHSWQLSPAGLPASCARVLLPGWQAARPRHAQANRAGLAAAYFSNPELLETLTWLAAEAAAPMSE